MIRSAINPNCVSEESKVKNMTVFEIFEYIKIWNFKKNYYTQHIKKKHMNLKPQNTKNL